LQFVFHSQNKEWYKKQKENVICFERGSRFSFNASQRYWAPNFLIIWASGNEYQYYEQTRKQKSEVFYKARGKPMYFNFYYLLT
jgi:hypothetical protein